MDALRKKLNTRAKTWNTKKPDPSTVRSERLKKKLSRGQPVAPPRLTDCNGCQDYPCGKTTNTCDVETKIDRCAQCGVKVQYRYVAGVVYYCPICGEETMNSYTVCARTGCDNRVAYNPTMDSVRHRYCKKCEREMLARLNGSKQCSESDIVNALMCVVVK